MLSIDDVFFTILDPETNKQSKVEVRNIEVVDAVKGDAKVHFNLTEEQKQIKNPQIFINKVFDTPLPPVEYSRNGFPVEHVRPPKPTKKWSRIHH